MLIISRTSRCIHIKHKSRTLGTESGDILIMNIDYILSLAYINVIVPCNVLDVLEFGPLGLYSSPGL